MRWTGSGPHIGHLSSSSSDNDKHSDKDNDKNKYKDKDKCPHVQIRFEPENNTISFYNGMGFEMKWGV